MSVYVRDMRAESKKDIAEMTGVVPSSKVFELLDSKEKRRMAFMPSRFNAKKRYSVVKRNKLIRHLVLKYSGKLCAPYCNSRILHCVIAND